MRWLFVLQRIRTQKSFFENCKKKKKRETEKKKETRLSPLRMRSFAPRGKAIEFYGDSGQEKVFFASKRSIF